MNASSTVSSAELLAAGYDEVAVERSQQHTGLSDDQWWNVYVQPGHWWDTVPTSGLLDLVDSGQVSVWDRATGGLWAADYYRPTAAGDVGPPTECPVGYSLPVWGFQLAPGQIVEGYESYGPIIATSRSRLFVRATTSTGDVLEICKLARGGVVVDRAVADEHGAAEPVVHTTPAWHCRLGGWVGTPQRSECGQWIPWGRHPAPSAPLCPACQDSDQAQAADDETGCDCCPWVGPLRTPEWGPSGCTCQCHGPY